MMNLLAGFRRYNPVDGSTPANVTRPPAPELVTPVPAAPEAPAALAVSETGRLIPLLPGRGASGTACASAFPPAPLRRPSAIAADHRPRESGRRQWENASQS